MSRFLPNAKRSLDSLLNLITDLAEDVLLFIRLLFRSRTSLSVEVLFLRKQLAFYEERQVQPRRLNDSARFSLILWSRLCNWKEALVIVKPETLIGWHRKGFQLYWKGKSRAGRPRIPENIRKLIAVFPPLQDHDKHSFPHDCKVAARMVLGGLHHEYR
jgi:putative transposase